MPVGIVTAVSHLERIRRTMKAIIMIGFAILAALGLPIICPGSACRGQALPRESRTAGSPGEEAAPPAGRSLNPAIGGVPADQATSEVLPLAISDAIARGLKHNLSSLLGKEGIRGAQGSRDRARSQLYPNLSAAVSESQQQVNLEALGFRGFPGMPTVVGPFSVFDIRVYLSQTVLDFKALNEMRSADERVQAAEFSYRRIRDEVALLCGDLYLQAVAGKGRIQAYRAQLETARALYDLAVDLQQAGVAPGIDVLRARVELQAQQQRLIEVENQFEKQKLRLAHAIGLPLGQQFDLTDEMPSATLTSPGFEDALERAYRDRADYQAAAVQVQAAESTKKAAESERLPSMKVTANYGINGPGPGNSHGSYSVAAGIRIPVFEGGSASAKILEAEAAVRQKQAELEDLRSRIYYELQAAFLNLKASEEKVKVAESSLGLSREQLEQARDRFAAGVANNMEVVEAQEVVADSQEAYISSLYAYNNAKGTLAHILGAAETSFVQFLRGNQ